MKKTNKELNQEYDARAQARVRPNGKDYKWKDLEEVVRAWVKNK